MMGKAPLTLYLGNKNYSSWSLRPWLALKHAGATFEEVVIPLDTPQTDATIRAVSPAGRVPILRHGEVTVWDSLAIIEYVAELFPHSHLWPEPREARAMARSVSAEMHSGFAALRKACPMDFRGRRSEPVSTPEVLADVRRVAELWTDCRRRYGREGRFLFGAFTAADCMFAPVVSRFLTYGVELTGVPSSYVEAIQTVPSWQEWAAAAKAEALPMTRYGPTP